MFETNQSRYIHLVQQPLLDTTRELKTSYRRLSGEITFLNMYMKKLPDSD